MKIILKKPTFDELTFRQALLSDEETMAYNHAYGGTISFTKDRWKKWYERWILSNTNDYFYRYIFDSELKEFVGEVAYHKDVDSGRYICDVIVMAKYRNRGYGKKGLVLLLNAAKQNGINDLYDEILIDNPSLDLFLNVGFTIQDTNDEFNIVRIEL